MEGGLKFHMIKFYLNGSLCEVPLERSSMTLSDYLRYEKCLTGTKVVCAEGDCGACSILRYNPLLNGIDGENFQSVNSCILPLALVHGTHVLTIESLAKKEELHEAQDKMLKCHASQCGYCTPGFAMALAGLCEEKIAKKQNKISEGESKNAFTGNLCRCTGYDTIIKAATEVDFSKLESLKERYHNEAVDKDLKKICSEGLTLKTEDFSFYGPGSYQEALEYMEKEPEAQLIASATDLGVVHNKRKIRLKNLVSLQFVPEAYKIELIGNEVVVGARVTLTELRHFLKGKCDEYAKYLDIFASPQIKNNATLAGNIANASPIGDNAPALLGLDATVILMSAKGEREVPLSEFFLDYRKTSMQKGELIKLIKFPLPKGDFRIFKTSIRKDLDISTVNLAVNIEKENDIVSSVLIGAGGVAATPLRLKKAENELRGKKLDAHAIKDACDAAQTEFTPIDDVRSSGAYRRVALGNTLKRLLGEFS